MNSHYISLTKKLTLREIKSRYKQSFLGLFWVILNPFFQMLIMSFVFSNIIKFNSVGVPYPIFIYAGLLPWVFFNQSIGSSMGTLVENAPLLKKIYFPREILILSSVFAKLFDFMLSFVIFILMMVYFQIPFSWYMLLFFPILFIQIIFTVGLGLLLASLNLFYRDIQYLVNLFLTLMFYLTPVIYATEFFPEKYRWIFKFNPLSVFINGYRQVLLGGDAPNWGSLGIGILISVVLFFISFRVFKKLEGVFADVV